MTEMPTRSQVEGWRTDHLDAAAKSWTQQADIIELTLGSAIKQLDDVPWDGNAADETQKKAHEALVKAKTMLQTLRKGATLAKSSSENLKKAKSDAVAEINAAENDDFTVNQDLTVTDRKKGQNDAGREGNRAGREARIRIRALALATTDDQIAAALNPIAEQLRAFNLGGDTNFDGTPNPSTTEAYENALREAGLLNGTPEGYYKKWLENAARRGVPPSTIVDIARRFGINQQSFDVLNGMEEIKDPDGKSFFLMPSGVSGDDARKAALMTYILNCGTDYGANGQAHDFDLTPYSANEVQRIIDRQKANSWSYDEDVRFVSSHGGRLVTTPNGMLMGLGGGWRQDAFSQGGGTTWGDIFMNNIDYVSDPAQTLRDIVRSGDTWGYNSDRQLVDTGRDLDRVLHHEERHSQQWAREGRSWMEAQQIWEWTHGRLRETNKFEIDAGLGDGGYTP